MIILRRVVEDEVRPLRRRGGIGTNRPSSEDRSLGGVRRPGSSPRAASTVQQAPCSKHRAANTVRPTPGGITVAGQRRSRTGFAGPRAILGRPRTGVPYRRAGRVSRSHLAWRDAGAGRWPGQAAEALPRDGSVPGIAGRWLAPWPPLREPLMLGSMRASPDRLAQT